MVSRPPVLIYNVSMNRSSARPHRSRRQDGVTRLDVVFTVAALVLLGALLLPALAALAPDAKRAECLKNLKALGVAYQGWSEDHDRRMPWRLTAQQGGLYDRPGNANVWVQQIWLSNYLASPKLLACPADKAKVATSWGRSEDGGLLHPNYRGNAVSYFVGIDVQEQAPHSLLSGDGNVQPSASGQACDQAKVTSAASLAPGNDDVQWTDAVHQGEGNLLLFDGTVVETTSASLRARLPDTQAVHVDNHVLLPR